MKQKILITGGGGYIGSVATYLFLQNDYEVVVIDNFFRGYHQPLELLQKKFGEKQLRYYKADLRDDLSPIFEKEKDITAVVHYGALCLVNESMEDPHLYFSNNVGGSDNLINIMLKYGVKNLVFSSTCAVYGEAQYVPFDEKHPTNPTNPYGESKLMVEKVINWYHQTKGLNYVIFRYFNISGASDDGLVGDSKKPSQLLFQNAVRGALGIEPFYLTCGTVDTPDKTPVRDYINVVDLNRAHLKGIEYLLNGGQSEVINLGTGTGNSVLEIIKKVEEATGAKIDMKQSPTPRKGEYATAIASIEKATRLLGWKPERTITDSVNSLIKWYKVHPNGWER